MSSQFCSCGKYNLCFSTLLGRLPATQRAVPETREAGVRIGGGERSGGGDSKDNEVGLNASKTAADIAASAAVPSSWAAQDVGAAARDMAWEPHGPVRPRLGVLPNYGTLRS